MSRLLQNAVFGTALILAVALLRRGLKGRLLPGARLALWGLCLLRLLAPAFPASGLSLWGLLQRETAPVTAPEIDSLLLPSAGVGGLPATTAPVTGTPALTPVEPAFPWKAVLLAIWIGVGALLVLWYALAYVRAWRAVARAIPLPRSDSRYGLLPKCARLKEGTMDDAPLTFGVVLPTVVLPPGLDGTALECVLAHEAVHARRRDNLWHYAMALTQIVYWWNPAVWLMARLLRQDMELSCDRAAVRTLGADRRAEYAQNLVLLSTQGGNSAFSHAFGRKLTEERIVMIMKYKKTTALGVALSLLLVSGVTVAFATDPIEKDVLQYKGNEVFMIEPDVGESLPIGYSYGNEEEMGYTYTLTEFDDEDDGDDGIDPQSVNISTDFTVNVGASFIRKFNMGVLFGDPHTEFKIKVTNANDVPYKVIIINNEGYERVTSERRGVTIITVADASSTAQYEVYIVNVGTKALTGHVTISSYY